MYNIMPDEVFAPDLAAYCDRSRQADADLSVCISLARMDPALEFGRFRSLIASECYKRRTLTIFRATIVADIVRIKLAGDVLTPSLSGCV